MVVTRPKIKAGVLPGLMYLDESQGRYDEIYHRISTADGGKFRERVDDILREVARTASESPGGRIPYPRINYGAPELTVGDAYDILDRAERHGVLEETVTALHSAMNGISYGYNAYPSRKNLGSLDLEGRRHDWDIFFDYLTMFRTVGDRLPDMFRIANALERTTLTPTYSPLWAAGKAIEEHGWTESDCIRVIEYARSLGNYNVVFWHHQGGTPMVPVRLVSKNTIHINLANSSPDSIVRGIEPIVLASTPFVEALDTVSERVQSGLTEKLSVRFGDVEFSEYPDVPFYYVPRDNEVVINRACFPEIHINKQQRADVRTCIRQALGIRSVLRDATTELREEFKVMGGNAKIFQRFLDPSENVNETFPLRIRPMSLKEQSKELGDANAAYGILEDDITLNSGLLANLESGVNTTGTKKTLKHELTHRAQLQAATKFFYDELLRLHIQLLASYVDGRITDEDLGAGILDVAMKAEVQVPLGRSPYLDLGVSVSEFWQGTGIMDFARRCRSNRTRFLDEKGELDQKKLALELKKEGLGMTVFEEGSAHLLSDTAGRSSEVLRREGRIRSKGRFDPADRSILEDPYELGTLVLAKISQAYGDDIARQYIFYAIPGVYSRQVGSTTETVRIPVYTDEGRESKPTGEVREITREVPQYEPLEESMLRANIRDAMVADYERACEKLEETPITQLPVVR